MLLYVISMITHVSKNIRTDMNVVRLITSRSMNGWEQVIIGVEFGLYGIHARHPSALLLVANTIWWIERLSRPLGGYHKSIPSPCWSFAHSAGALPFAGTPSLYAISIIIHVTIYMQLSMSWYVYGYLFI